MFQKIKIFVILILLVLIEYRKPIEVTVMLHERKPTIVVNGYTLKYLVRKHLPR